MRRLCTGVTRSWLGVLSATLLTSVLSAIPEPASAATSYWYWAPDYRATMPRAMQRKKPRAHHKGVEPVVAAKSQPEGPLIIAISIQHQQLKLYDVNGLYAESPVSTGMAGHSTPMGVFSVLEKQRWHRSNIYSGAPMPYMQRITWSGVAMHEGVLPGYPASHGCIRMPGAFAVKLWAWTKRGARVIIAPGEISPSDFSHPKLIAHMVDAPPSYASATPAASVAVAPPPAADKFAASEADKVSDVKADLRLATLTDPSSDSLALPKRPTNSNSSVVAEASADPHKQDAVAVVHKDEPSALRDSKTPDATEEIPAVAPVKLDATPVAKTPETEAISHERASTNDVAAEHADAKQSDGATDSVERAIDKMAAVVEPAPVVIEGAPREAGANVPAITVEHAIDRMAAVVEPAPVQIDSAVREADASPPAEKAVAAVATPEPKPAETTPEPKPADAPARVAAEPADITPKDTSRPEGVTASVTAPQKAAVAAPTAEAASPPPADPRDIPTVIAPKRTGHVAVYISRKDRRLYVRQNFNPVFDAPVEITDADKPFGTFVFTARGDKDNATTLHWSVVAMPIANRKTVGQAIAHNGKRMKPVVETILLPSSSEAAAEALDRITVPEWALERVAEAIKPGGSIVVSDHGLGDETGEGTDFIVPLR